MRAVDTNVLVRLGVRDDAEQVGAAEEFCGFDRQAAATAALTPSEST
jgi:predicted nucleic-acid-binding protein